MGTFGSNGYRNVDHRKQIVMYNTADYSSANSQICLGNSVSEMVNIVILFVAK